MSTEKVYQLMTFCSTSAGKLMNFGGSSIQQSLAKCVQRACNEALDDETLLFALIYNQEKQIVMLRAELLKRNKYK